jgi:hypothetical protein
MKTLIVAFLISIASMAHADNSRKQTYAADIGPAQISTTVVTGASFATPNSNQSNCLEYAVFSSSSIYTISILDGNTTDYSLTVGAAVVHTAPFHEPFCASRGASLRINVVPTSAQATYQLNYKGFVGQ